MRIEGADDRQHLVAAEHRLPPRGIGKGLHITGHNINAKRFRDAGF